LASNQEEAIKQALVASGGKTDAAAVQDAYNKYVESMVKAKQAYKPLSSFK
jgi:hypothetical protein